ncbi:MAG: hypothetical protein EZS28_015487 [Streblomastix strix]|uniref:Uncharacterized protein n=1 Tax=Streblomastix strix TaxID=222440 RepID=A0A5J4W1X5_9EUKA|nr:MAG: hypothetical protein EZS28_015487 [Streblomastix strix]
MTKADTLLDEKLNISDQIDAYSKTEDEVLLLLKADKTELDSYVDLISTQTIKGQKQFGIISVSNISEQNKNDASILLAGGGGILVSSLVSQPQLQDVQGIALGKSKENVFATTEMMNTWLEDQEKIAKLAIGDNLYIIDQQFMDYWWDGTSLRAQETEQPIMRNVMTIFGVATGRGNVITGQKTFNTTIHSVRIMIQNYDNNSIVYADGGADKTELIDAYSKTEADALLDDKLNVSDQIDTYTKQEDDALLLLRADKTQLIDAQTKGDDYALLFLKADKTQLIDAYTKGEAGNLLNKKADYGVSYTKGEDDALLLLKTNQSATYTKTDIDQLISQIEVSDAYLSGYMTLDTVYTINANKTFNNVYRLVSSIDGMASITGSKFVKSGADDTVVLLGAGGTKPISEFTGTPTDLSDYYTKAQTYSKTETDNKYIRLDGSIQQTITGRLKYVSPFGQTYDETQDPVANTHLTISEVDSKLTNYVNTTNNQIIYGTKTFNSNVNAAGFAKSSKDDTSILLAGGGDRLLSSFGGIENLTLSAFSRNYNAGSINPDYFVQDDVAVITYISFPNHIVDKCDFAGLSDLAELYVYIKERYPMPIGELPQPVPIGDQTLQQQVKNNDDIIYSSGDSNEVFELPISNAIMKFDLNSLLERQSFLASNGSDLQLIVYDDRITLIESYATIGQFPGNDQLGGYLFKSYPQEARPKAGAIYYNLQVAAIKDCSHAQHYILQIV